MKIKISMNLPDLELEDGLMHHALDNQTTFPIMLGSQRYLNARVIARDPRRVINGVGQVDYLMELR